jgi:hypothetical protein
MDDTLQSVMKKYPGYRIEITPNGYINVFHPKSNKCVHRVKYINSDDLCKVGYSSLTSGSLPNTDRVPYEFTDNDRAKLDDRRITSYWHTINWLEYFIPQNKQVDFIELNYKGTIFHNVLAYENEIYIVYRKDKQGFYIPDLFISRDKFIYRFKKKHY